MNGSIIVEFWLLDPVTDEWGHQWDLYLDGTADHDFCWYTVGCDGYDFGIT